MPDSRAIIMSTRKEVPGEGQMPKTPVLPAISNYEPRLLSRCCHDIVAAAQRKSAHAHSLPSSLRQPSNVTPASPQTPTCLAAPTCQEHSRGRRWLGVVRLLRSGPRQRRPLANLHPAQHTCNTTCHLHIRSLVLQKTKCARLDYVQRCWARVAFHPEVY